MSIGSLIIARRDRLRARTGLRAGILSVGALALALVATLAPGTSRAASSTVGATVLSSSWIDAAGCATGTANITDFGLVQAGAANVTTSDCVVRFGSSNDTAALRTYLQDSTGPPMSGASDGTLDTLFSPGGAEGDGKAVHDLGPSTYAYAVVQQPDGKLLVGGKIVNATDDFYIVRYNSDGSLDTTFGVGGPEGAGAVATNFSGDTDIVSAMLVQPDGKIIAVGESYNLATNDDEFGAARYKSDGTLDSTFGAGGADGDGRVSHGFGGNDWNVPNAVTLQSDGRIVLAGTSGPSWGGATYDFALARLNSDGSLDTSFSPGGAEGDGRVVADFTGARDEVYAVSVQADGTIVVTGRSDNGPNDDMGAAKFTSLGVLDATFGVGGADGNGRTQVDFTASNESAWGGSHSIDAAGRITMAGTSHNGIDNDVAAARLTATGVLDTTFAPGGADGDGRARFDFTASADTGSTLLTQLDGKLVIVGSSASDFAALRINADGILDPTFAPGGADGNGKVRTDIVGGSDDFASSGLLQGNGEIVLVGKRHCCTTDVVTLRYGGGASVPSYFDDAADIAGTDWGTPGAALFGACLRSVADGAVAGAGGWTANATCPASDGVHWNAVPSTAPGSRIASTNAADAQGGGTDPTVNLRFGFRTSPSQAAGTYLGAIVFETVAPNT